VAQDDVAQVDAPAIMPVRRRRADSPQRFGHELRLHLAVEIALVEVRTEIVALHVRKEIAHHE
jgi:hypothetical protein